MAASTVKRAFLIVNPTAGRGLGAAAGTLSQAALRAAGVETDLVRTDAPGHAVALARDARAKGEPLVVAVGGDGTLHEVANGLIDAVAAAAGSVPAPDAAPALAPVPVGSGNDYVKMLGIPRGSPGDAARAIASGAPRLVDVGLCLGCAPRGSEARPEVFLNNLGLAFTGDANERIGTTRGLPGGLAYFVGAAMSFFTYRFDPYELEADGKTLSGRPTIIHVNVGRYCGGGVIFTPEAELDDGLLDVFYMAQVTRLGAAIRWRAVTSGRGKDVDVVTFLKVPSLRVRGDPSFVLHADGEVRVSPAGVLEARILPKALRVVFAADRAVAPSL